MRLQVKGLGQSRPLRLSVGGMELTIDKMEKEETLTIVLEEPEDSFATEPPRTEPESVMAEGTKTLLPGEPAPALPESLSDSPSEEGFFQRLSAVRRQLACQQNVPPYIIFNDKTLRDMMQKLPTDMTSFSRISGVGSAKLEKYGLVFLKAIAEYMQNKEVLAG